MIINKRLLELKPLVFDMLAQFVEVCEVFEWTLSFKKLEGDDANAPDIDLV